jgi:hypothetical protein
MKFIFTMQEKSELFSIIPIVLVGIKTFYFFVFNGFTFLLNFNSLNKISAKLVLDKIFILASLTSKMTFLNPQTSSLTHSTQGS